jgi:ABC-2 type transport system permease protein
VSASLASLVLHDLKLGGRGLMAALGNRPPRAKIAILAAVFVGLHVVAWPVALWLGAHEAGPDGAHFLTAATRAGAMFVLPWAIASPMTSMTRMLYQRGDLDLLFASPMSARAVLAARALGLAFESVASSGLLLAPLANACALQGRWHWLALYPALAAAGLFGAGAGLILALSLYSMFGPRRARVFAQIVATLVGASAVLFGQLVMMLTETTRERLYAALGSSAIGGDAAARLLSLPARAAGGDVQALIAWGLLAVAAFGLAIALFGNAFWSAALRTAGAPATPGRAKGRARFSPHLGAALRAKEIRLLRRDPWLLSQMLLQGLYTLPIGVVLWRNGGISGTAGVAFGPTLVVIACQFSGALAWIALSAEDAPDFLATAPATRARIDRAKLAAIALPVALVMTPPLIALAWASPWGALCALVCGIGASLSGGLLMLWRQTPSRRGLVLRRHSQSKLVALTEHWLSLLWALTTAAAVFGSLACLIPVAVVAATLWMARPARPRAIAAAASPA